MEATTVYTTSDGRTFTDDEPAAAAHQANLDSIREFCAVRKVPEGRAQSHARNLLLAWLDWSGGHVTVAGVDVPERELGLGQ